MKNRLALEKVYLQDEVREEYNHDEIVGHSKAIKDHSRCHRMRD